MRIGANRCDDKCENTVLLETHGPCGSVRKCSGDTMTDDTSAEVKMSHPYFLASLSLNNKQLHTLLSNR